MYSLSKSARVSRSRLRIAVPVVLLFTAACASTPPIPSASLQAAQQSIANAERVEAGTHAPAQLGEARNKLSAAQRAVDEEKMIVAGWLAEELPIMLRDQPWRKATVIVAGTTGLDHDPAGEVVTAPPVTP